MRRIIKVSEIVESILDEKPYTRSSDNALYLEVCKIVNPACICYSFGDVLLHINEFELPQFESVSRLRRKLQEIRPDLLPDANVINGRYEGYKAVIDYVEQV